MGTATDYCVKFTVLDALQLGYKVNVITDGCRGVNIQPRGQCARVYGDVSSWGNAIYAGRLGRDAGVILVEFISGLHFLNDIVGQIILVSVAFNLLAAKTRRPNKYICPPLITGLNTR